MIEFLHIFSTVLLLFGVWSTDDCSEVYSFKILVSLYAIIIYIVAHYFKPK